MTTLIQECSEEIPRLSVSKLESGNYAYTVSYAGQTLYEAEGMERISAAILEAIDTKPRFAGFKLAYAGYVVGTYTTHELSANTESISAAAVQVKAKFWQP